MTYPYRQTSPFTPPFGSSEDIELNQAILNSLRPTTLQNPQNSVQQLPQPTWNNGTQYIPVQTTTTYIPFSTQQISPVPISPQNRTQTLIPPMSANIPRATTSQFSTQSPLPPVQTNFNRTATSPPVQTNFNRTATLPPVQTNFNRTATLPPVQTNFNRTSTLPPIQTNFNRTATSPPVQTNIRTQQQMALPAGYVPTLNVPIPVATETTRPIMPYIPPLSYGTTHVPIPNGPVSPRDTNNFQYPNFSPTQPTNFMHYDEQITSPRSPGRMTNQEEDQLRIAIMTSLQEMQQTPQINDDDYIENALLEEAIRVSIEAAEQARLANFHAHQALTTQYTSQNQQDRMLRQQQDDEFNESERIDRERADEARKAAEAATKAAEAAEQATKILQMAKLSEDAKIQALKPPLLQYPIEAGNPVDIFALRFRLPTGSTVTHSFHKEEPLKSVIQQLRFDTRHVGDFSLSILHDKKIDCSPETSIAACGIGNRVMIIVNYSE